jgi:hypothetical protein
MRPARIYREDWEIASRLEPFGVTREELIGVVHRVVSARADAVDDDPLPASGQFAYIFGTRHLHGLFGRKKWVRCREENIESTKHPDRDLEIVYQGVALAASSRDPRAISGNGAGANRVVDSAPGPLFTDEGLDRLNPSTIDPVNTGVWFFCVSVGGGDVCAELSLPKSIGGNNFKEFWERIFIIRSGEWRSLRSAPIGQNDIVEPEPKISRK